MERLRWCVFVCLYFVLGATEAFEKWERPLGWHPQYGPRYVMFWGGPAGYTEPSVGTSTYSHYAAIPLLTKPPLSAFEDFRVAKLHETAKAVLLPPVPTEVAALTRLPFFEASPAARYASLSGDQLPFSQVHNAPQLIEAAKAVASELCVDFVADIRNAADASAMANLLETQGARLLGFVLSVFKAARLAKQQPLSEEQKTSLLATLKGAVEGLRHQKEWASDMYAYWMDASNALTEDGKGPYYVAEMEISRWRSALFALSSRGPPAQGSPFSQLLATPTEGASPSLFLTCEHFTASAEAPREAAERGRLCSEAFLVLARQLVEETDSRLSGASERGQGLLKAASQRLKEDLTAAERELAEGGPFSFTASAAAPAQP